MCLPENEIFDFRVGTSALSTTDTFSKELSVNKLFSEIRANNPKWKIKKAGPFPELPLFNYSKY